LKVRKKEGKLVYAYPLGSDSLAIKNLIEQGNIVETGNGTYEVFSQEALGECGEFAIDGDYIKVDSAGKPYPNSQEFFQKNHRKVEGDLYEQSPVVLQAWSVEEGVCEEIDFLLKQGKLKIDVESEEHYFEAFLWGTLLSAKRTAVIVFYNVERNERGEISDIDFNFVEYEEFCKTYDIIN